MNAFKSFGPLTENSPYRFGLAVAFGVCFGFAGVLLGAEVFKRYGWGLFVGLPFCVGFLASWILLHTKEQRFGACVLVSFWAVMGTGIGLFSFQLEGLFCLVMALPLCGALAVAGAALAFGLRNLGRLRSPALGLVALGAPLWMGTEAAVAPPAPLFEVTTAIVVEAPPQEVWERLVSFSKLPAPKELLFRAGIAYPTPRPRISARIG